MRAATNSTAISIGTLLSAVPCRMSTGGRWRPTSGPSFLRCGIAWARVERRCCWPPCADCWRGVLAPKRWDGASHSGSAEQRRPRPPCARLSRKVGDSSRSCGRPSSECIASNMLRYNPRRCRWSARAYRLYAPLQVRGRQRAYRLYAPLRGGCSKGRSHMDPYG